MKKFGFSVGLVIIAILLLLQTRFNFFLQLDTEGYAVRSNTLRSMLLVDPNEEVEEDTIELYSYKPLDYIYSRAGSYYMGEEKKTQIDLAFPLYINGGAGLLFTGNSGTLFDVDYETVDVYQGLSVTNGETYNPGGSKADGIDFVFYGTGNGFFYNLKEFTYIEKGKERTVNPNSAIYFTEDYFVYCELEGDLLRYQVARFMTNNSKIRINGQDMPFHELLIKLGVISDKKQDRDKNKGTGADEIPVPTPEINDQDNVQGAEEAANLGETEDSTEKVKNKKEKSEKKTEKSSSTKAASESSSKGGSKKGSSSQTQGNRTNTGEKDTNAKGVRPDSMRPDKAPGEKKPAVVNYVKPTVTFNSASAGVYRIMLDMTVKDPASRIDRNRRIQYEFYEISEDGKSEKLVYRTYSSSTGIVTAGDGNIKPDTNYRVNIFFTYDDEYDERVTESVKSDIYVRTQPFDQSKAKVEIRKEIDDAEIVYGTIPYFYDNYMEITNFTYKMPADDKDKAVAEEYLYGINNKGGMTLTIKKSGLDKPIITIVDSATINKFKNGVLQDFVSSRNLEPNSKYSYEITMKDFFGNPITVINGTGEFETCKSRPKGKIELTNNVIGNVAFDLSLTDPDNSAVMASKPSDWDTETNGPWKGYDLYFVLSTEDINKVSTEKVWGQTEAYIKNGNKRVEEQKAADGTIITPEGTVHYVYKIPRDEYLDANGNLNFEKLSLDNINTVDLNTKYYAYILGDFDLNNKKGPVYHEPVASYEFKSATLSSLGNIYVNTTIAGVTAHGANIIYDLNEARTNDVLTRLLSDIEFDIDTTNGEEPATHSKIIFDSDSLKIFTGYQMGADGIAEVYTRPVDPKTGKIIESVIMDESYFDKSKNKDDSSCQYYLESMTDYKIVPKIYATYNGKKYEMKVTLTEKAFKTMREPAKVDIQNVVLAGGTLRFDVHIADPDEAITGISNKTVIMNLYDAGGNFVKAIRYQKNQYDENGNPVYFSEEITGLDPNKKYSMTFIAVEYNEGYDNSTFVSNKRLLEYKIDDIVDIRGSIKLHGLDEITGNTSKLTANLYVDIEDHARLMTGRDMPYYIKLEKNGVDVTGQYSNTTINEYELVNSHIKQNNQYIVDKGNNTYKATLYIKYNNKDLILDTITFNSKDIVKTINTAEEFYDLIKADSDREDNGVGVATGRYCVTADLNLGNSGGIPILNPSTDEDTDEVISYNTNKKPVSIATTFNGEIDFQGFDVTFSKTSDSAGWFTNIGPKGEIYNLVLDCDTSSTTRVYDNGLVCDKNYGHVHDIYIHYKGGNSLANEYYGLVARYNTVSGIIENFVIHSDDMGDFMPFTAYHHAGLVCSENQGVVRYGYVYGSDIYTAYGKSTESLSVGGIVGENARAGQVYDVYSSVNIILDNNPINHTNYGSVVGQGNGQLRNMYSTGEPKLLSGAYKDTDGTNIVGTVTGGNKSAYRNVCYWNERNIRYTKASYQQRVSLENINDYAWQKSVLEDHFNVQPVEVGYYPHVIWSTDEMPQQEYVPLPNRTSTRLVELLSSEVLSYSEDGNSAEVLFRFSNTRNALITGLDVDNLTVTLDMDTINTEDGFTTVKGTLSDPKAYRSQYEVNSIKCSLNGNSQTVNYDGVNYIKPVINADFYRLITNPDEWYEYVVKAPTENARLGKDIDFTGVPISRIRVTQTYTGKLDGGTVLLEDGSKADYGHTLKNINFTGSSGNAFVFADVNGSITNVCVDHYTNNMTGKDYMGFVYRLYGTIDNFHMKDIELYGNGFVAPIVCRMEAGSFLQNSSVNGLTSHYVERTNVNSNAYIGGLVAYMTSSKILNCYAADIDIQVNDVKSSDGIGGIVGRVSYGLVENVYATGSLVGRCQNVGGIVGFYESDAVTCDVKNAISNVDVTSYQDAVGGLIGQLKLTANLINPRNNLSGVAFGNVNCANATSENVSYTIGYMSGSDGAVYGSEFQLINGLPMPASHFDPETGKLTDHTHGLINYSQAINPAVYTDSAILNMDGVYDYSYAAQELVPKLYYAETNKLLPFQNDIRITDMKKTDDLLTVSNVIVNETNQYVTIYVNGPAGYKLCRRDQDHPEVLIEDLEYYTPKEGDTAHPTDMVIPDNGELALRIYYYPEAQQKHYKDMYMLTEMSYISADGKTIGTSTFNDTPVAIPLTMYGEIKDIATWNHYLGPGNEYGRYENYRVVADIDFSQANYEINVKVGRLVGKPSTGSTRIKLNNVKLSGDSKNLLFRVNSELSNFSFEDCDVNTKSRNGYGLIATSCGLVKNVGFKNVSVEAPGSYAGLIAWQYGGSVEDIEMENININSAKSRVDYVAGLIGYSNYGTVLKDIRAKNVNVYGRRYVAGIIGYLVGSLDEIHGEDFVVTGCEHRVGGIVGCNAAARQTNGNSAYLNNVSIKGTPVYDDLGNIVGSTTVVSLDPGYVNDTESYDTGAIAGYCGIYVNGFKVGTSISSITTENHANAEPINVDGVIVKGYGNYIGAAYGRCVDVACTKVTNSYVGVVKNTTDVYNYMGSVAGYVSYNVWGCEAENCVVDAFNHGRCGILVGYNGSTLQYNNIRESKLFADSDKSTDLIGFGGITGYTGGQVNHSLAKNIVVDASAANMQAVGGIIGYMNNQVFGCSVYCDPVDPANSPSAKAEYYVKGNKYVGGVAGRQYSNQMLNSYSNINVIGGTYAGGISGRYDNNYTTSVVNGKTKYAYSSASFRANYFAGTVEAEAYAGGLVGSLGTVEDNTLTSGREKSVSGSDNEVAYTYRNLMVGEYIQSGDSNAYAFAGNLDGFEGRANYDGYTDLPNEAQRDIGGAEKVKYARSTMFWEKTKLISSAGETVLNQLLAANAPEYARNVNDNLVKRGGDNADGEKLRYAYYAGKTTVINPDDNFFSSSTGTNKVNGLYPSDDGNARSWWNTRIIRTVNMQCANMYWSLYWNNQSASTACRTLAGNGYRWVILTEDIPTTALGAPYNNGEFCASVPISYLPQTRAATDKTTVNTYNNSIQIKYGMKMPIPRDYATRPVMMMSRMMLFELPPDNYGILYASDVDRINVEFGQDLVDNGYFVLKAGGKVVDRQIIRQRVYTYSYDQSVNLELCYGQAKIGEYMMDYYDYDKGEYIEGRTEDGIFDKTDEYLKELGDDTYKVASLRKHIMTYGTKYYYISDEGLVEGSGSSVVESDGDDTRIVDLSATTMSGEFLSIYNGHALLEDGSVIDVTTKQPIRTLEKGIKCLNNAFAKDYDPESAVTASLQNFSFNGTNTTVFHKYTDYDGFGNSGQFMTSANGDIVFIDNELDNKKDAVTFYLKGDEQYCTIVDSEGFIQDLYRGGGTSSINAPEDMHMSGVVNITNNLSCTAPFILVEYANGGILGYNYMTGEYLFNNYVRNVMNLEDYIKVYFEGDKPEKNYADYAANAKLAKLAVNADRLSAMVLGENTGLPVDDIENNAETAFDPDSKKSVAKGEGTMTGDNTSLREAMEKAEGGEDKESLDYSLSEEAEGSDKGKLDGNTRVGESDANGTSIADGEGGLGGLGLIGGIESSFTPNSSEGKVNDGTQTGVEDGSTLLGTSTADGDGGASGHAMTEDEKEARDKAKADKADEEIDEYTPDDSESEDGIKEGPLNLDKPIKTTTSGVTSDDDELADKAVEAVDKEDIAKDKSSKDIDAAKDSEDDSEEESPEGKASASKDDNLNIKTIEEIDMTSADPTEEPSDSAKVVETKQTLIAVYNAATGEYEILDMTKYMSDPTYKSENSRLAVRDLTVYSDYHAEQKDTKKENGLWMYILSILAVLGGIGGGVYFKKKHNMKV